MFTFGLGYDFLNQIFNSDSNIFRERNEFEIDKKSRK
jgi:hypothetical protein